MSFCDIGGSDGGPGASIEHRSAAARGCCLTLTHGVAVADAKHQSSALHSTCFCGRCCNLQPCTLGVAMTLTHGRAFDLLLQALVRLQTARVFG
jgi:hypothetical protein